MEALRTGQRLRDARRRLAAEIGYGLALTLGRGRRRSEPVVIVGSGWRTGSTWLARLLGDAHDLRRMRQPDLPRRLRAPGGIDLARPEVGVYLEHLSGRRLFKTHAPPSRLPEGRVRAVTIVRDPRDVLVSLADYLAHRPDTVLPDAAALRALAPADRLLAVIDRCAPYLGRLEAWWRAPGVVVARYEDLLAAPLAELCRLSRALRLPVDEARAARAVARNDFRARAGRPAGVEAPGSFHRKGVAGDWRRAFDARCAERLRAVDGGRWSRLVVELGYEPGDDRTGGAPADGRGEPAR
jgi:hypothetical protein